MEHVNIQPKWDQDSFLRAGSIVLPHLIDADTIQKWKTEILDLGVDLTKTVGGRVPEIEILRSPSQMEKISKKNKNMIRDFVWPLMDKLLVPRDELLQVWILLSIF